MKLATSSAVITYSGSFSAAPARAIASIMSPFQATITLSLSCAVVTLGATALKSVLEVKTVALGQSLGQVLEHEGRHIVPTYHPSYILRLREEEEKAEAFGVIVNALRKANALVTR